MNAIVSKRRAWLLGLGGLIPFFSLAALSWTAHPLPISTQQALAHYGAGILSFVGAIHWGVAIAGEADAELRNDSKNKQGLIWSVVPCLYAVVALQFAPNLACMGLAIGLLVAWGMDSFLYAGRSFALWFLLLRTVLTLGAAIALIIGAFAPRG